MKVFALCATDDPSAGISDLNVEGTRRATSLHELIPSRSRKRQTNHSLIDPIAGHRERQSPRSTWDAHDNVAHHRSRSLCLIKELENGIQQAKEISLSKLSNRPDRQDRQRHAIQISNSQATTGIIVWHICIPLSLVQGLRYRLCFH